MNNDNKYANSFNEFIVTLSSYILVDTPIILLSLIVCYLSMRGSGVQCELETPMIALAFLIMASFESLTSEELNLEIESMIDDFAWNNKFEYYVSMLRTRRDRYE